MQGESQVSVQATMKTPEEDNKGLNLSKFMKKTSGVNRTNVQG
jgi:hypothetical protein